MCKYNLTQDNFQLACVTVYSRQVESDEQLYDLGNGIVGYYFGESVNGIYCYYGTTDTTNWKYWDMYSGEIKPEDASEYSGKPPTTPPCIVIVSSNEIVKMPITSFANYENFLKDSGERQYGQEEPFDYVTFTYKKKDKDGKEHISGTLKIVNISYLVDLKGARKIQVNNDLIKVLSKSDVTNEDYPQYFRDSMTIYAYSHDEYSRFASFAEQCKKLWTTNSELVNFARDFYLKLKKALPVMMSYRYFFQSCNRLVNRDGKKLTDYDD